MLCRPGQRACALCIVVQVFRSRINTSAEKQRLWFDCYRTIFAVNTVKYNALGTNTTRLTEATPNPGLMHMDIFNNQLTDYRSAALMCSNRSCISV